MSPLPNQTARLLSTAEAAEMLLLSSQTLRRWRCRGVGPPFVKVAANRVAYRPEALREFVASREFESTTDESAATALRRVSITP